MRIHIRHLLATAVLVSTGIVWTVAALVAQGSKIQQGADLAPVPLNMKGLNPALVRGGSYIVNAQGGCNDCHTVPSYAAGGNPFAGEMEQINVPCRAPMDSRPAGLSRSSSRPCTRAATSGILRTPRRSCK